jgi:hypothetical protein
MTRILRTLLVLWVSALVSACGSSVAVGGHWQDPSHKQGFKNVLVVGMAKRGMYRRLYEDEFTRRLIANGVKAQQSYMLVPGDDLTKEQLEAAVQGKGFDAVMLTHLVDIAQRREYHEGPSGAKPMVTGYGYGSGYGYGYYGHSYYSPYYGGMGAYYSVSYSYTHSEGYYETSKTYNLETALYALGAEPGSEKLVWALMTEAVDPDEIMELIGDLAELTFESLKKDGLL